MKTAARHLRDEFDGTFGVETIEQFLTTSYDQFAGRASFTNFLPLMAERFARQRLKALAKVEGKADDGRADRAVPLRAQRRPLADGPRLVQPPRRRPGHRLVAAAPSPAGEVNPAAVAAMAEVGIDIASEYPKPWTDEIVRAADVVVTMGCGDACPIFPGKRYEDWELDDPAGLGVDAVRPIRDEIERRVRDPARRARGVGHPLIPTPVMPCRAAQAEVRAMRSAAGGWLACRRLTRPGSRSARFLVCSRRCMSSIVCGCRSRSRASMSAWRSKARDTQAVSRPSTPKPTWTAQHEQGQGRRLRRWRDVAVGRHAGLLEDASPSR